MCGKAGPIQRRSSCIAKRVTGDELIAGAGAGDVAELALDPRLLPGIWIQGRAGITEQLTFSFRENHWRHRSGWNTPSLSPRTNTHSRSGLRERSTLPTNTWSRTGGITPTVRPSSPASRIGIH